MMKKIALFIFLLIPVGLCAQSVLKLRFGGNYYMGFSPHRYVGDRAFTYLEFSNGILKYEVPRIYLNSYNIQYPFLMEYEHNRTWSFTTGLLLNGAALNRFVISVPNFFENSNSSNYIGGSYNVTVNSFFPLRKVPFLFSFRMVDIGARAEKIAASEKAFFSQIDLVVGGGYWYGSFPKGIIENPLSFTAEDYLGNTYFNFRSYTGTGSRHFGCLTAGLNFRFRTRKHEYATLTFMYEQGLKRVGGDAIKFDMLTPDNKLIEFERTISMPLGSNLSVQLTFPVFTYNFTKKKFYRD
jgi:hypothetical protein